MFPSLKLFDRIERDFVRAESFVVAAEIEKNGAEVVEGARHLWIDVDRFSQEIDPRIIGRTEITAGVKKHFDRLDAGRPVAKAVAQRVDEAVLDEGRIEISVVHPAPVGVR